MTVGDILKQNKISISYEFFPPRSEKGAKELFETITRLSQFNPAYVSVTYGAGGTTRELTHDLIVKLKKETDLAVVSHLTCVGSTRQELEQIIQHYSDSGINNFLALRGDPPKGQTTFSAEKDGLNYASELVEMIRSQLPNAGIGVAGFPEGHPECPNRLQEIEHLKRKVDRGADYICTQLFFDNHDFYDFKERCELAGINIPIIAGIMPITSKKGLRRMAELALGARIPAKLQRALARAESDEDVQKVGIHWASEQVRDLIDQGVNGIHFYTLNKSRATVEVYENLGIHSNQSLQKSVIGQI